MNIKLAAVLCVSMFLCGCSEPTLEQKKLFDVLQGAPKGTLLISFKDNVIAKTMNDPDKSKNVIRALYFSIAGVPPEVIMATQTRIAFTKKIVIPTDPCYWYYVTKFGARSLSLNKELVPPIPPTCN